MRIYSQTSSVPFSDGDFMGRYRKLGYVALNVSDVSRSARFYEHIVGLTHVGVGEQGEVFLRCSGNHHDVVLYHGPVGLVRLGWEMESAGEVERMRERAMTAGLVVTDVPLAQSAQLQQDASIRITVPHVNLTFEFYSAMARAGDPFKPNVAKIERLGHVVVRTPMVAEATACALEVFNFRHSDSIDGMVNFLRCFPNHFHHSLAFSRAEVNGLHHVNFMVSEIDDIGKALTRLKRNEVPIVYGPGRHPPSESVFLYFLDPDGMTVEYSFGMETFEETGARGARTLPAAPTSFDHWGNIPDPRMGKTGAIVDAGSIA
jgi:2,3-dihydroxy-p-cumate/2,3-dihydroxybenzoate 3,4-dioxygenase